MKTHKAVMGGGVLLLAALGAMPGCMRDVLEVGRNTEEAGAPDTGGSGGKNAAGGTLGRGGSSGRSATAGAGGSARGGAGTGGGENGGSTARAGATARGGSSGAGTGGAEVAGDAGDAGRGGAGGCAFVPTSSAKVISLDEYCSRATCPALTDFQNAPREACSTPQGFGTSSTTQTTGCGRIVVSQTHYSDTVYFYDAGSGELMGVYAGSDTGPGFCAGDTSAADSCADATTCQFCAPGDSDPPGVQACQSPAPFDYDPACNCHAVEGEFSCTLSTAAAAARILPEPTSCDNDYDYVSRANCDQTLVYRWSVGTENEYEVDLDTGVLTYMSAYGYVGALCGISDSYYQVGSVEAGTPLTGSCDAQCAVCSTGDSSDRTADLPACEPCSDRTQFETNTETLADYCKFHHCPVSLAAAKAELTAECSGVRADQNDSLVTTGCGTIRLVHNMGEAVEAYYFDAQTEVLVGAAQGNDVPGGNCQALTYAGGTVPADACTDATPCSLCAAPQGSAGSGAGGMGAGGVAGTNGTALPPACGQ